VRPGRVLFGGLAVLYLLAYLRGSALLLAATAAAVWLLWRALRAGGRTVGDGAGQERGWIVDAGRAVTERLAAEAPDTEPWQLAPTVVYGVPEPLVADRPGGFAVLVELRDGAGRQAMLQVEAAHPADVDLDRLVRQALTQAARRAGWHVQRWQPITDDVFAPAWDQAEGGNR
jgi:hypothetical protein